MASRYSPFDDVALLIVWPTPGLRESGRTLHYASGSDSGTWMDIILRTKRDVIVYGMLFLCVVVTCPLTACVAPKGQAIKTRPLRLVVILPFGWF